MGISFSGKAENAMPDSRFFDEALGDQEHAFL
jgi:hypothetical protein